MSRIGLLSDSHGRAHATHAAAMLLVAQGAQMLLHLGDIGSVEVVDAMVGLSDGRGGVVPVRIVFGNTDWDAQGIATYARRLGVMVDDPAGTLFLDEDGDVLAAAGESEGKGAAQDAGAAAKLVFTHGHEARIMQQALEDQVKYLCHGHTHRATDQQAGATRVINPGALFRAQAYTVAVLDTRKDEVVFYPVGGV